MSMVLGPHPTCERSVMSVITTQIREKDTAKEHTPHTVILQKVATLGGAQIPSYDLFISLRPYYGQLHTIEFEVCKVLPSLVMECNVLFNPHL